MVKCCAIGCRNPGTHIFPKDDKVRILWEKAVNRKNFKSTKHSRLCSEHFSTEDYIAEGFYTGLRHERKILRKGVVPTSFNKLKGKFCKKVTRQPYATNSSVSGVIYNNNTEKPGNHVGCVESDPQTVNCCSIGTQKYFCFFSIDSLKHDNKRIYFYTGLKTYDLFIKVYQTLGPDADSLCYKRNQDLDMPPKDQFLLTLIKLKRDKDDYELGYFFDVHQSSIANIINTWVNFIYSKWNDKYKINDQLINMLAEEENNMVVQKNLNETNSFTQEEIISKSTVHGNDLESLGNLFFITKVKNDKIYTILMPKMLFICKILTYFNKGTEI